MPRKPDIKNAKLLNWDDFLNKEPHSALPEIYTRAIATAKLATQWYWTSISNKRTASTWVRFLSFLLLLAGVVLPITAGITTDQKISLELTQSAVALLAAAGLFQAADKIFGWSSGWLRYTSTVVAMEHLINKFELDWTDYMLSTTDELDNADKKQLFELARKLEEDVLKLVAEETEKWISEFNSSQALLNDLIKNQKISSEASLAAAKTASEAKKASNRDGGVEVTFKHKATPVPVNVHLDTDTPVSFTGNIWSKLHIKQGLHTLNISEPLSDKLFLIPIDVQAGAIEKVSVDLT